MSNNDNFEDYREKQLQLLLGQARSNNNNLIQQKSLGNKIVNLILYSRPICHRFQGKPLSGIYREIYQEVKQKMFWLIMEDLNDPKQTFSRLSKQQKRMFRISLDDLRLKQFGLTAREFPANSELRSYGLDELIRGIKLSGKLCRPHIRNFPYQLYQGLYDEALTETFAYICLNIDRYDPDRGNGRLMNWVNFHLNMNILQCYKQLNASRQYNLTSLKELDEIPQQENTVNFSDLIYQYISQDSQGLFRRTHIRDRPEANFKIIALAKLDGKTWQEIAMNLDISPITLSDFYNRWCNRFASLLKKELERYI
jgi:hypothetical protein